MADTANTDGILHKIGISSDAEIIEKVLNGDTGSFEILIRRYNPLLYKIARGYGFNHQDAEDLMQEAHFKAFTSLKELKDKDAYKPWLSRIIINNCLYKLKYGYFKYENAGSNMINESDIPLHSRDNNPHKISSRNELSGIIETALKQIPLDYRTVFVLREVEGFSVSETASLLGITEINVKVRLNRARAMLQKKLEQSYSYKELFEFNLVYCDNIVKKVFQRISGI